MTRAESAYRQLHTGLTTTLNKIDQLVAVATANESKLFAAFSVRDHYYETYLIAARLWRFGLEAREDTTDQLEQLDTETAAMADAIAAQDSKRSQRHA